MPFELFLSPQGHLHVREAADADGAALDGAVGKRIHAAFSESPARGLLHLATTELESSLPPPFGFARDFARLYLTRLCQTPTDGEGGTVAAIPQPSETDLAFQVLQAPPMQGCEYLSADALASWWSELDTLVRDEIAHHAGGVQAYLSERNPQWRLVGRVTFHLAENKRDPEHPFAFLATYIPRLSAQGRVQHEPLGKALQQYAGAKNRPALLSLLVPIQRATERSPLVKEMVESSEIYHPLAWTPREAYRFLQDIPDLRGERPGRPGAGLVEGESPASAGGQCQDRRPQGERAQRELLARFLRERDARRRAAHRRRRWNGFSSRSAAWWRSRGSGSRSTARSWRRP